MVFATLLRAHAVYFLLGAGKTTLVGLLTNGKVTGRAGFKHDTVEIAEYESFFMQKTNKPDAPISLTSVSLMDTRGFMDVDYTPFMLMNDLAEYRRFHASKVIIVVKQERLYKMQYDFLHQADRMMNGDVSVVLTSCSPAGVEDFKALMNERKIRIANHRVVCYHEFTSNKTAVQQSLFQLISDSPFVNIDRWYRHGYMVSFLDWLDFKFFKILGKVFSVDVAGMTWVIWFVRQFLKRIEMI